MRKSIIFVFLDGFGLGATGDENPLFTYGIPSLEHILGTKLVEEVFVATGHVFLQGIDAKLGIRGIPQSATGQTSLLTGINAQAVLGYHLPAFPNESLVQIIERRSVLKQLTDSGCRATFANAYTEAYFAKERNMYSVTTHCVRAAALRYRTTTDLRKNNAVYWDITRENLIKWYERDVQQIDSYDAGLHLVNIAGTHDFVLYECFEPDLIGHASDAAAAAVFLEKLDRFFSGILASKTTGMSLVICSDHGNIENLCNGSHSENMVPLIAIGPIAPFCHTIEGIDQVIPVIVQYLTEQ